MVTGEENSIAGYLFFSSIYKLLSRAYKIEVLKEIINVLLTEGETKNPQVHWCVNLVTTGSSVTAQ